MIEQYKNGVWTERDRRWLLTADEQTCLECKRIKVCWVTWVWDAEKVEEVGPWCFDKRQGPKSGCCFCVQSHKSVVMVDKIVPCQECQQKAVEATKKLYAS